MIASHVAAIDEVREIAIVVYRAAATRSKLYVNLRAAAIPSTDRAAERASFNRLFNLRVSVALDSFLAPLVNDELRTLSRERTLQDASADAPNAVVFSPDFFSHLFRPIA